ncbi:MAG: hypothetical protein GX221_10555 [Candidatus Riflebacteria bacterium]|nr:hypothetical protein [Candidatus Riflebacteria bacterium]
MNNILLGSLVDKEVVTVPLPPNAKSYLYRVEGTYESALYTPFYQTLADKLAGKHSMTLNAEAAFKNALHTRRQPLRKITIPQTGGGWMGPGAPPWAGGPGGHP